MRSGNRQVSEARWFRCQVPFIYFKMTSVCWCLMELGSRSVAVHAIEGSRGCGSQLASHTLSKEASYSRPWSAAHLVVVGLKPSKHSGNTGSPGVILHARDVVGKLCLSVHLGRHRVFFFGLLGVSQMHGLYHYNVSGFRLRRCRI